MADPNKRETIERAILMEEEILDRVAGNISQGTDWWLWSIDERQVFSLAVVPPASRRPNRVGAQESNKALRIRDEYIHQDDQQEVMLTLGQYGEQDALSNNGLMRRAAERLRSDLIHVVNKQISIDFNQHQQVLIDDIREGIDTPELLVSKQKARF